MPICGAKTEDGKQCQNRVSEAGQRCHLHSRTKPSAILSLSWILSVCSMISTIAKGAEGVDWIYHHALPHIEPLLHSGLFSPERFWKYNLALPIQSHESPAEIHSKLELVLEEIRRDYKGIEAYLAGLPEPDRERIADAYAKVFSEIRARYPHLADVAPPEVA